MAVETVEIVQHFQTSLYIYLELISHLKRDCLIRVEVHMSVAVGWVQSHHQQQQNHEAFDENHHYC